MSFHSGDKVEVARPSDDESWEPYMNEFVGLKGVVVDPDATINDYDTLIEVSISGQGTFRLPQDCLRVVEGDGKPNQKWKKELAGEK
jgi:hypothetical protein